MDKSIWVDLENGIKDPLISSLWKISEGLDIKPHISIKMVEDELSKDFSFLEG